MKEKNKNGIISLWLNRIRALFPFIPPILFYKFNFLMNKISFAFGKKENGFSLLLITHNRSAFLKMALNTIIKNTTSPFEIIILSNACTDDTDKIIDETKKKFPVVSIIHIKKKFNCGTNGSALAFLKSKYNYIIDCDDDILAIQNGWDRNIINAFENFKNLGFLALDVVKDRYTDGAKPDISNYSVIKKRNTTIQEEPAGGWFAITERKTYYRAGGFIFLPNKPFRLEDGDFSRKVKKKEMIISILSDTFVYYACGPKWNAKGKYQEIWKEKYRVDYNPEIVNLVDDVIESDLPDFEVPEKMLNEISLSNKA